MYLIYKICSQQLWSEAQRQNEFLGAPIDIQDGFIHFSTGDQVAETAAKHFAGLDDLLLISVDPTKLGPELKWEASRGGDLFPHLYGPFPFDAVIRVDPLPLENGEHLFPADL